jgi:putative hydrolase of the HAD superfamily
VVRAVLFDLDDTLFDHRHCARAALEGVYATHEPWRAIAFDDFERAHGEFLEELHAHVIAGRMSIDDARRERFRRLFGLTGETVDEGSVRRAAAAYRECYMSARRAVDGAVALLPRVRARAKLGIVSNNLLEEQQQKLRDCGLTPHVDALVVSETAGVSKPDPRIFRIALAELDVRVEDAVMVGDSWSADVMGARAAGMRPIWFNRLGLPAPDGETEIEQIRSLEPADEVLSVIFNENRR